MHKFFALFAVMAISNIHASQHVQVQVEGQTHIFEQFKHKKFVSYVDNFLIQTRSGRNRLLDIRVGEILNENFANAALNHLNYPQATFISSSYLHAGESLETSNTVYCTSDKQIYSGGCQKLEYFVRNIAALERFIIKSTTISCSKENKKNYEKTRVHDLYLLILILENNPIYGIDLSSLLDILKPTHDKWRPQELQDIVHSTSAYTIVQDALNKRQIHIDFINTRLIERFKCEMTLHKDEELHSSNDHSQPNIEQNLIEQHHASSASSSQNSQDNNDVGY